MIEVLSLEVYRLNTLIGLPQSVLHFPIVDKMQEILIVGCIKVQMWLDVLFHFDCDEWFDLASFGHQRTRTHAHPIIIMDELFVGKCCFL